jgi:hypothetical protein
MYRKPVEQKRLLWQMARAMQGPVMHLELVFVNHFVPTSFCLTSRITDKYPKFIVRKLLPKTKQHRLVFYEFTTATAEQVIEAWNLCEKIVKDQEYQMCTKTSIASVLPANFSAFFKMLYTSVLRDTVFRTPDQGKKSIYCVTLTGLVLNKVFPTLPPIGNTMNATDLLVLLTRQGLVKRVDGNPPNYNPFTKTIFMSTQLPGESVQDEVNESDADSDVDAMDTDAVFRDLEIGLSKDSQFMRSTQSLFAVH